RIGEGRPLDDEELRQMAIQGMGMFIGNAVAQRLAKPAMDDLAALGARLGAPLRRAEVQVLAAQVARTGDPDQARALLLADRVLIEQELRLYERIAADPAELDAFGASTLPVVR